MNRSTLPILLLVLLLGLLIQSMLFGIAYASALEEWTLRGMNLLALLINLVAVRRLDPATLTRTWAALAPVVISGVLHRINIGGDSEIIVFLLPLLHGGLSWLLLRLPDQMPH
ncbi:hypothetical protein [Massilia sp. YIM B04103]|uniref:hypothetical protein n=1 Tax=Massilia sp. YIM B04103 TaxID=2963106 RepID=UPI0021095754|nr:hypothetical protein [Massilia sp. YIM B04103]